MTPCCCSSQALIQYGDIPTAENAANTLEGYTIFEGCCRLRLSFSRHTDLNVKFQSERSRDFTVLRRRTLASCLRREPAMHSPSVAWVG